VLFTQPIFLGFFAVVFTVYWLLPENRQRKVLLLVASYVFYGAWDWRFLFLIAVSTMIDYVVGWVLRNDAPRGGRKLWLITSLCANLGILGFFKYYNFFVTSGVDVLRLFGYDGPDLTMRIVLPVGISFFTFQSMSYTIDVYRKQLKPIRSAIDFALFVSFFPQLVAGPIVRAADFLPQLDSKRRFADVRFKGPIALFLIGFFKKVCLADNVAACVDQVYAAPSSFSTGSIWLANMLYSIQLYCDFSGYTDMAIATAALLGYELCINFDFPYLKRNILELWSHWHMSFSTWIRDYLFIPLGGSRGTALFTARNVMITMLLAGLWHGAAWHFVLWGGANGLAMIMYRLYRRNVPETHPVRRFTMAFAVPITFFWWTIQLIMFRATDLHNMFEVMRGFFIPQGGEPSPLNLWAFFVGMAILHWVSSKVHFEKQAVRLPAWACSLVFGAAAFFLILLVQFRYKPFVYFQF